MAAAYHHGTETIRIDGGSSPVYTVDGAITAIIERFCTFYSGFICSELGD